MSIYERLQIIKDENKKVDYIREQMDEFKSIIDKQEILIFELSTKITQLQDQLSGKVRADDLYDFKMKIGRDIEDVKKIIYEKNKDSFDVSKVVHKEVYEKEIEELKTALEAFVRVQPSALINKDYELRLKKIEERLKTPLTIPVKTFK
jgi:hypothetical protein